MSARRALAAACALAALAVASGARADLVDDADRVEASWQKRGATVERRPPAFLEHGRVRVLSVPEDPKAPADGCTTVLLLAGRATELVVRVGAPRPEMEEGTAGHLRPIAPDEIGAAHSVGGAATIARCGEDRADLSEIAVEMRSARGAVEVLVARSAAPMSELKEILPERSAGPLAPRGDPGRPIEPGPIEERVARAEKRARVEGASSVARVTMRSSRAGDGEFDLKLPEGCHRIEVMAEVPAGPGRRPTDVDAEVFDAATQRLLARDRADVPDARVDLCVGEVTSVAVRFAGASGAVEVMLADAVWPIPPTVPVRWGARARAGIAAALLRRHVPAPALPPIAESLGAPGIVAVAVEVEPGRCYVAAVTALKLEGRALRLTADVGGRASRDEGVERSDAAAVAFCSETARFATFAVDARGGAPWALAVWAMGDS